MERRQLRSLGCLFGLPPRHLPGRVFQVCPARRRPQERPRISWRDYVLALLGMSSGPTELWLGSGKSGHFCRDCCLQDLTDFLVQQQKKKASKRVFDSELEFSYCWGLSEPNNSIHLIEISCTQQLKSPNRTTGTTLLGLVFTRYKPFPTCLSQAGNKMGWPPQQGHTVGVQRSADIFVLGQRQSSKEVG